MPTHDFENIGDVLDFEILKGKITAIDSAADTCTVDAAGSSREALIFYHCKPDSIIRDNGAIEGGAAGFKVDDEVIVMINSDASVIKVIGHIDGIRKCELPIIYIDLGSKCILWDVEKEQICEDILLDSSTSEEPEYATFPCAKNTITKWIASQQGKEVSVSDIYMNNCGRNGYPSEESPQLCPNALDAEGLMDNNGPSYAVVHSRNDEWYKSPFYSEDKYLVQSRNALVSSLNSAVWYRVASEMTGSGGFWGPWISYHWWGDIALFTPSVVKEVYNFFASGAPFGEPFHTLELNNNAEASLNCVGHIENYLGHCDGGWPEWNSSGHEEWLYDRLTGYPTYRSGVSEAKVCISDKLIFHLTYIAYISQKADWSITQNPWDGSGHWGSPRTASLGIRTTASKINIYYNKNGFESYDLKNTPAAPPALKDMIDGLVTLYFEEMAIPVYVTTFSLPFTVRFFGWTEE
jgi:hypothetical protein